MSQIIVNYAKASILALLVVFATGCAHLGSTNQNVQAIGYYAGHWYGPNPDKALGELNCTISPSDNGTWDALFFATFGGMGEYEVELIGKTEGESIVFTGSVDLGKTSGGVFDWKGTIRGDIFDGSYTSQFIDGTFKMLKTIQPSAE